MPFALFDFVVAMGLVDEHATDGAGTCSDNGACGATNLGAYESSTDSAAGNELGLGVVVVIVSVGLGDSIFV